MATKKYPYLYDEQIRTHLGQFMRVFSGFQYDTGAVTGAGEPITDTVRVVFSSMDRIAAETLNEGNDRPKIKLPVMGVSLAGFGLAEDEPTNPVHVDEVISSDKDGARAAYQKLVGPSLTLSLTLTVYTSSVGQMMSLLEQILLVFNEKVTVRVSNDSRHSDRHSSIRLTSIDSNMGTIEGGSKRMVSQVLNFEMPLKLRYPITDSTSFIDTIVKRTVFVDPEDLNGEEFDLKTVIDSNGIENEEYVPVVPPTPTTRFAPNFNGISQLAEYDGKLIDVDNLNGLVLEGYFAGGDGTFYSQSTSTNIGRREFQIYSLSGEIICVVGGDYTPIASFTGDGVYKFEFTRTDIVFSFNSSVVTAITYSTGLSREPDAKFRIGARANGATSSYAFFKSGICYNHKIGDVEFKFNDGFDNNPNLARTGGGQGMIAINMTEASWTEIPL